MARRIFITGGARSGKSSYAESLLADEVDVLYLATGQAVDEEMVQRIARHKARRNPKWRTHEGIMDLGKTIRESAASHILLDCVTNWVSNLIFLKEEWPDPLPEKQKNALYEEIQSEVRDVLAAVEGTQKTLILVSNEVGMGLVSEYALGRLFVDFSGFIHQYIAQQCDEVYFMVAGLPLKVKGHP
ncbi:Adenosylcobinamide kinase [Clostridiaceae bacterium JG1575]|nr:Adenosylcobinamide kinase [Clostridiaceae bacterium JG1575]